MSENLLTLIRHLNLQIQEDKSKEIDTKPLKTKIRIVIGGNRKMAYDYNVIGLPWQLLERIVSLDGV